MYNKLVRKRERANLVMPRVTVRLARLAVIFLTGGGVGFETVALDDRVLVLAVRCVGDSSAIIGRPVGVGSGASISGHDIPTAVDALGRLRCHLAWLLFRMAIERLQRIAFVDALDVVLSALFECLLHLECYQAYRGSFHYIYHHGIDSDLYFCSQVRWRHELYAHVNRFSVDELVLLTHRISQT